MFELGITGAKNSGKTTLMVSLVKLFVQRGYRTATVKHTGHNHSFDQPGKDSFRHREAGSGLTFAVSEREIGVFTEFDNNLLEELMSVTRSRFDICLVEGNKFSERDKVLLTDNLESLKGEIPSGVIATYGTVEAKLDAPHFYRGEEEKLFDFLISRIESVSAGGVEAGRRSG